MCGNTNSKGALKTQMPQVIVTDTKKEQARERNRGKIQAEDVLSLIPVLRRRARSLSRDATFADDLVRETLLRAIASAGQFRLGANLEAWLLDSLSNCFRLRTVEDGASRLVLIAPPLRLLRGQNGRKERAR